ncbi:MAG: nicotinate dehydrogenase subunit [Pseudonocardiales bacterium]|jgi:CO/xanthine dehydrogenase Mo-binding subunit|nr:nicotinate dehydrogenase subunit [Pseudonocardiales bacterium]
MTATSTGPAQSPSLAANPRLADWLTFAADGTVIVHTGKVELGQGILTALTQIVADELDVSPARIRIAAASTNDAPDEGYTSGSLSVQHSGAALRQVCAEVRVACRAAAAAVMGIDADELTPVDGVFSSPAASVSYWQLPTAALLDRTTDGQADAKAPSAYRYVGSSEPRIDLPAKLTGTPCYLGDLVLPAQLHARVVRPASRGATLIEAPTVRVEALDGVHRVVRQGDFLAVVGDREETAIRGAQLLADDAYWDETDTLPDEATLSAFLHEAPHQTETLFESGNEPADCETAHRVTAVFSRPYLAHGSIGTSTAIARWDAGVLQVWTSSQGIYHLRSAIARALDLDDSAIVVQHVESAGCYGHNGADDAAFDAALLAHAIPGRPIRVVWSRQDELGWSPLGPAMRVHIDAATDSDGRVCSWHHEIWSNGHTSRPGPNASPGLLGHAHQQRIDFPPALDPPLPRGGGSGRNGVAGYSFARQLVRTHRLTTMPLRTSAMRALGAHLNVFAIESVMDDLAAAAGRDPLEFRLAHLDDARGRRVLQLAAERGGWGTAGPAPGVERGIGYARYKGVGAYCAVIAEVEALDDVRVRRLTIVADVGGVINPDGVINQIEGGAIQSMSWTLKERIRFDRRRITSDTWESYPIVTFSEVPEVDVVVVPSRDPSVGAGEASVGPTAAALGNALAAVVGVRVRELPLNRDAIVRAIQAE